MLPKKLFVVDQAPLGEVFQVTRAVVIAEDEEAALGRVQACVDDAHRYAHGVPSPLFVRGRARVLRLADSVATTPAHANHGVVCVETSDAAATRRTSVQKVRR